MIESVAAAREEEEEDSGPSDPRGDGAPSHSVTLESEKTDRAERPLSSEYGSPPPNAPSHRTLLLCFSSVFLHLSSPGPLTSAFISSVCVRVCAFASPSVARA